MKQLIKISNSFIINWGSKEVKGSSGQMSSDITFSTSFQTINYIVTFGLSSTQASWSSQQSMDHIVKTNTKTKTGFDFGYAGSNFSLNQCSMTYIAVGK